MRLLRLAPGSALKHTRLVTLLGGGIPDDDPRLRAAIEDAQMLGSLQLAGFDIAWEQVRAARRGESAPAPLAALWRARAAVPRDARFSLDALRAWHAAAADAPSTWRRATRIRDAGPPPAPPEFIASRLELLASWLETDSSRELAPAQAGALAMARLIEIAPFDDANGRVARLAASHVMVRAGARPPVLVGADRARLEAALQAAFQLHTEPLTALLDEAGQRALDVMLQTLEGRA